MTDSPNLIGDIIAALKRAGCIVEPCGSRVTCNPPPVDTDADYLVQVPRTDSKIAGLVSYLSGRGFEWEGGEHYQMSMTGDFMSFRHDYINFIVTANEVFAARHRVATGLCRQLNLMQKPDRIALFQAVLYGVAYDPSLNKIGPVNALMALVEADPITF